MKIVFFGTPHFAAELLKYLLDQGQDIVAVVTRPDKPKGRRQKLLPSDVKAFVQEVRPDIPVFQPEKASTEEFAETLRVLDPDLFVVAAYGEIIKKNILSIPKKGCLNVHPSLLPKYRGATPIQQALLNGDHETGTTIMDMVLKMDAGDIYATRTMHIPEEMNFGELEAKLCDLSGPVLIEVIRQIEEGKACKKPQDESEATYVSKISFEDRIIDWSRSAEEIHNQIRAFAPKPGAFCFVEVGDQRKRLNIRKTEKIAGMSGTPGQTLRYAEGKWIIACGSDALSVLEVQLEGKKNLPIETFSRGCPKAPKIVLS